MYAAESGEKMGDDQIGSGFCRICNNQRGNKLYRAREMFMGSRDPFTYVECAVCGTLQIQHVPDLRPYYSGGYYSFRPAPEPPESLDAGFKKRLARLAGAAIRKRAAAYYCNRRRPFGELRHPAGRYFARNMRRVVAGFPNYLKDVDLRLGLDTKSAILDVGSGAGDALVSLRHFGFTDLTGIDPFLESSVTYANGVRVLKGELSDLARPFDLIMANHSLEHVPDPRRTLGEIFRLLRPGHYAVIRIPVKAHAWQKYKTDWVQLDPPRHLFLFTARTFNALAEEAGFKVDGVVYDSTAFQFWGSEQYVSDIPLMDSRSYFVNPAESLFTPEQIDAFTVHAGELNAREDGDQVAFYIRKPLPTS
jgi:SAM-dependent methyltransferase